MKSLARRNKILNDIQDCHLAFFVGCPEDGGIEIGIPRTKLNLAEAKDGCRKNATAVDITVAISGDTPLADYWAIFDAETGGEMLYYFTLSHLVPMANGTKIAVKPGNLIIREE
jgi:hypothetical protein|nr:MAG TPA: hypothetical protein [Caudoviricetes sp.]